LFSSADPRDRQNAAWGWGFLEETVGAEPLLAALGDAVPGVRTAAASALGWLGDPRAIPTLQSALKDPEERVQDRAWCALDRITQSPK
jgi:HEAT repeat protein